MLDNSIDSIRSKLLFHGTSEEIIGPLIGGSYDGVFWTAEDSATAQNYIPEAEITLLISASYWRNEDIVRPEENIYPLTLQMGYTADISYDEYEEVRSWHWYPKNVLWGDIFRYIEELGYKEENGIYQVKSGFEDGKWVYRTANYKMPGQLFIISGRENLKIFDYAGDEDGSLLDPQYHHLRTFKQAAAAGYDAIKINDFAQSKNWGNIGHWSIGLFPSGLAKISYISIPAVNFDWGKDLREKDTPEFLAWAASLKSADAA